MEDKVIILSPVTCVPHWSFFAVCDGHGGDYVAQYLSENLGNILSRTVNQIEMDKGKKIDEDSTADDMKKVLLDTCESADLEISKQPRMKVEKKEDITCKDKSGSTGLFCLISKRFIVVANVGDSRALLAQWGTVPTPTPSLSPGSGPLGVGPGVYASPPQAGTVDPSIPTPDIPRSGILVASALSVDHKFSIAAERERAESAGAG